ncbi:hypothetical protein OG742_00865 [Streptomyces sp. NBC_00828]
MDEGSDDEVEYDDAYEGVFGIAAKALRSTHGVVPMLSACGGITPECPL